MGGAALASARGAGSAAREGTRSAPNICGAGGAGEGLSRGRRAGRRAGGRGARPTARSSHRTQSTAHTCWWRPSHLRSAHSPAVSRRTAYIREGGGGPRDVAREYDSCS